MHDEIELQMGVQAFYIGVRQHLLLQFHDLLLVDKFSRYKFIYGLKNLTSSLNEAMTKFLMDCGSTPTLIRTDFDYKLMGGNIAKIPTEYNHTV
jgi:hypothetical protein